MSMIQSIASLEKTIFSDPWSEAMLSDTFKYDYNHVLTIDRTGALTAHSQDYVNHVSMPGGLSNEISYELSDEKSDRGGIAGYIIYSNVAGESELLRVAVDESCRGKGYASILMKEMLKNLAEEQTEKCILEVRSQNAVAIGLYNKFGFTEIGVRKGYYKEPDEDALIMEVSL